MPSRHRLASAQDPCTRRAFLRAAAGALLGVALNPTLGAAEPADPVRRRRPAQACILLFMRGGMSHLDTFDPKPLGEVAGPVQSIPTAIDGCRFSEHLPLLARQAGHLAVVRSLTSNQGAHEQGEYYLRTSYAMRSGERHPALGSWLTSQRPRLNPALPGYVSIDGGNDHPGAGFLETRFAPLPLRSPEAGLPHSTRPADLSETLYRRRLEFLRDLNAPFLAANDLKQVRAYRDMYDEAVALMASRDLTAFDLAQETPALRTAYGDTAFGQGCLLARRLVEHDVRCVEVVLGGWDTHDDNFTRVAGVAADLDRGLSMLLSDLQARGLLDRTLVVVASEFGRTPQINAAQGRDHHPKVFSGLLAGGPVRRGIVHGATDERAATATTDPVTVPAFNATIAAALGLVPDRLVLSPEGRPFTIANKGLPVTALLDG